MQILAFLWTPVAITGILWSISAGDVAIAHQNTLPATTAESPINPVSLPSEDRTLELSNQFSDMTAAIDSSNVGELELAWSIDTDDFVSHSPLVEGDRLYFADWGGTVYAANANTGEILWKNTVEQPMVDWPWYGFAGTGALGGGLLYEASVEGTAFGIDPDTGEVVWQTDFADDPEMGNIGTPLYYDGLLYIGVASVEEPLSKMIEGFEANGQGKVVALNAQTGELVWEKVLVPSEGTGATVWSSFALDPEMGALFFTTGNNYVGEPTELSDSLVAVDAKTGDLLWGTQTLEHDVWLGDFP